MKRILFLLFACSLFIGCGDPENDPEPENPLQLSANECTLTNEKSFVIVEVEKSEGDYKVQSSDEDIVITRVVDGKIYIWGFRKGNALVTVTDKAGNKATVKVVISEEISRIIPLTEGLFIKKGETRRFEYEYTDAKYLLVMNNDDIVSGQVEGSELVLKGEKIGESSLYVLDNMWPVHGYSVYVVDKYPYLLINYNNSVSEQVQIGKKIELLIYMGNGEYSVNSSHPTLASAYISDYEGAGNPRYYNPAILNIEGVNYGDAIITVTDSEGLSKDIKVVVYP
jgi:hypothetical protein